ncbi:MAG: PorT family protein [Chlorobi bacterium]|nr:PorT family protein [Chlorobiota bacterium]
MRKTLIVALIFLSTSIFAQHRPFQFGFKGGLNIGWFATDAKGYKGEGVDFGGSWGFTADIFIMENYSFTSGFDVIYLNSSISFPDQKPADILAVMIDGQSKRKYKAKYVELPLIFTMKTNKIGKVAYYGQIGFGMSFLISAKADEEFNAYSGSYMSNETFNAYDDLSPTRESFIVGAGVEFPIQGSTFVRTGIKFDNAFVNVLKGYNNTDAYLKNNGRNSFVELNASVFF